MSGHEYWDEQAAGYALHALAPEEESEFVAHLAECDVCARSVDDHALTAAELGALAHDDDTQPPAWSALRDAVVSRDSGDDASLVDRGVVVPTPRLEQGRARREMLSRRILAVVAGLAVLAAAGVASWRLTSGSGTPGPVAECRASVGCHLVTLRSSQTGRTAGNVVVASDGNLTMVSTAMAPAASGRTYVLWQVPRDGRPQPVHEFTSASAKGAAAGTLVLPYSDLLEFAISSEPANALPTKPSMIVAVGATT